MYKAVKCPYCGNRLIDASENEYKRVTPKGAVSTDDDGYQIKCHKCKRIITLSTRLKTKTSA